MSTNLPQSQWLDQVARGIEQACPCPGRNWPKGEHFDAPIDCLTCHGSAVVRPYAESGVGGWLCDRPCPDCKGIAIYGFDPANEGHAPQEDTVCDTCHGSGKRSEWPSLVFAKRYKFEPTSWDGAQVEYWTGFKAHVTWLPVLDFLDALALLEEAGWRWWRQFDDDSPEDRLVFGAMRRGEQLLNRILWADSPGELLDKIREAEEKHAADGR